MPQRITTALLRAKAGNISENLLVKSVKLHIYCIELKKLLKKYITI